MSGENVGGESAAVMPPFPNEGTVEERQAWVDRWVPRIGAQASESQRTMKLHARNLAKLNFDNMQLPHADLSESNLSDTTFLNCDLHGAKFLRAFAKGARLKMCMADRTDWTRANLEDSSWSNTSMKHANLSYSWAPRIEIDRCDAYHIDLTHANLTGCQWTRGRANLACIAGTNFYDAHVFTSFGRCTTRPHHAPAGAGIPCTVHNDAHWVHPSQWDSEKFKKSPTNPLLRAPAHIPQQPQPYSPTKPSAASNGNNSSPPIGVTTPQPPPLLFPTNMIRALIAAMLTRPMVLLAGISGSGKTQLARRIGAAYAAGHFGPSKNVDSVLTNLRRAKVVSAVDTAPATASTDAALDAALLKAVQLHVHEVDEGPLVKDDTYAFTSVRSDWTDATHLWGYLLPTTSPAQFHATGTLRVFLAGQRDTSPTPRFVLLDEMNLARPEHYGSDLLSAMEVIGNKEKRDGALKPIELHRAGEAVDADPSRKGTTIPATAAWPKGLVVVGTVNVDETTFSFAPKVLDRAAVLEFTHVDLAQAFKTMKDAEHPERDYNAAYTSSQRQTDVVRWFTAVQAALEPHNLHLAYRAAKECMDVLFVQLGDTPASWDGTKVNAQLDQLLMSKVLPRVRGPRETVEDVLEDLLKLTAGGEAEVDTRDAVKNALTTATPNTARRKILQMLLRAHDVGFAGFFG